MYKSCIKRKIDFIVSLIALVVFSPILILVAILVRFNLGSPVIFKQERPGLNEEIFTLYKFRTMSNEKDQWGELLPDELRLTKFGKFLRSTSLDELPELWNIIRGDMSIVGPRPLEVYYLPYYNEEERLRHSVMPGLTGLAQINGRTAIDWETRFYYDNMYVKNITFLGDIKIILKTIIKVFKREDIIETEKQGDFSIYRQEQLKSE